MKPKENLEPTDEITCQSCGAQFECGAAAEKCWCFGLEISAENLAKLKIDFSRCLCRQCLEKLSNT